MALQPETSGTATQPQIGPQPNDKSTNYFLNSFHHPAVLSFTNVIGEVLVFAIMVPGVRFIVSPAIIKSLTIKGKLIQTFKCIFLPSGTELKI